MPEAPDLQVIKEFLERTLPGQVVARAQVLRPIVLRSLASASFTEDVIGRQFAGLWRRGKLLGLELSEAGPRAAKGQRLLVINPMLSGGLHYCRPSERLSRSTFLVLALSDGMELRYFDEDQMGMVYYLAPEQLSSVPRLTEQGPDVLDHQLSFEEFKARLKPHRGETKGVLTRGGFIAGIGNAYADEILFAAGLFPFRKTRTLKEPELQRLHQATYAVPTQAVAVLRERVGKDIHLKVRDFLQVHGKGDQPCPRCGARITSITANGRLTNYCRRCQPGSLFRT
ncbi:MAG: Fpg/Nei family DNA glycosylase [Chloroflexi bacterium]|nr:Fpg/Nei family DNA glycosylase [Chloroflexota bacterium]